MPNSPVHNSPHRSSRIPQNGAPPGSAVDPIASTWEGVALLLQAYRFLRRERLWWLASAPAACFLSVLAILLYFGLPAIHQLVNTWISPSTTWYGPLLKSIVYVAGVFITLFVAVFAATLSAPWLCAPALDRLVHHQAAALKAPLPRSRGLRYELLCTIRAQLWGWLIFGPPLLVLSGVNLMFAPSVLITFPLQLLFTSLSLGWSVLDIPLSLAGIPAGRRFALLRRHYRAALGLSLGLALLFWVPFGGVVLLPVGVVAATRLMVAMMAGGKSS